MKSARVLVLLAVALAVATSAGAALIEKEVSYPGDGATLKGFLVWDDSFKGQLPGILVVHEWWGHNEYARSRARLLASMGYVALAVDMYGDGRTAQHPDDAGKFATQLLSTAGAAQTRFLAARTFLWSQRKVDRDRFAAIGYCFGGGVVLEMARRGLELDAVASFHGSLATENPAKKGKTRARVAVFNGDADPMVTAEEIAAFRKEMDEAGVDYTFVGYPEARHSFTNPAADELGKTFGLPLAYNEKADQASWEALRVFLAETFPPYKAKKSR